MSRQPNSNQRGVALLIAIFALLLISGAAVAMIMMAGTESSLNANYRRSTIAFYGANAGLEEARERMVPCSPQSFWPNTACATPPVSNDPMFQDNPPTVIGQVLYVVNPSATDPAFNPQTDPPTSAYYDSTFINDFGAPPAPNPLQITNTAAMTQAGGLPPLTYKWVRITLKSEAMGGIDLDGNAVLDTVLPVRVDGNGRQCMPTQPGCAYDPNAPLTTKPVYRVTAFAMEPTGARRLVQAEVAAPPVINPSGAIASQAGVSINGNFNAFGAWPPIVSGSCGTGKGKSTIPTCGSMVNGAVAPDCNQPYSDGGTPNNPADDTCGANPRPYGDYCNQGTAVNTVSSGGNIAPSGNYTVTPDAQSSCSTTSSGCISTVSPNSALSPNQSNWPYDMNQIIDQFRPPVTDTVQNVDPSVTCGPYDVNGNRTCSGATVNLGSLPSPWPPPAGTIPSNYNQKLTFADVGPSGVFKITANGSVGSGVLVVDGDLEVTGGLEFYGLIIVRGTVKFLGGGSGGVNVIGGILAGSSVTNVGQTTTVGGSVAVTYSSCAFRYSNQSLPLRYLSFREVSQ